MNDIRKDLEQDAQVITEKIPVAKTKAREVAGSLKAFMADHNFSHRKIADMIGVSNSVVSQFLACKYKGDTAVATMDLTDTQVDHTRQTLWQAWGSYVQVSV